MQQLNEDTKLKYYWQSADEYLNECSDRLIEVEVYNYINRYADKETKDAESIRS